MPQKEYSFYATVISIADCFQIFRKPHPWGDIAAAPAGVLSPAPVQDKRDEYAPNGRKHVSERRAVRGERADQLPVGQEDAVQLRDPGPRRGDDGRAKKELLETVRVQRRVVFRLVRTNATHVCPPPSAAQSSSANLPPPIARRPTHTHTHKHTYPYHTYYYR